MVFESLMPAIQTAAAAPTKISIKIGRDNELSKVVPFLLVSLLFLPSFVKVLHQAVKLS